MALDNTVLFGYGPGLSDFTINLPILRIIRSGKAMVGVFFVLSGYVLTVSPARYFGSPEQAGQLYTCIALAALKRPLRLFLPSIVVTFIVLALVILGIYPSEEEFNSLPAGLVVPSVIRQDTVSKQIMDWLGFVFCKLTNPWAWTEDLFANPHDSYYGTHLWTIQAEFRCSVIMLAIMGCCSLIRRALRRVVGASMLLYCAAWSRWDLTLFLVGMNMAIWDRQHDAQHRKDMAMGIDNASDMNFVDLPILASGQCHRTWQRYLARGMRYHVVPSLTMMIGLWMASFPDEQAGQALGYGLLSSIWPAPACWQSLGAAAIVWSAGRTGVVRGLLSSKATQYLGTLSFPLYLIHLPFLELAGWRIQMSGQEQIARFAAALGVTTSWPWHLAGNVLGYLAVTSILLCISDIASRAIDQPIQRFLRNLVSVASETA
jgi:peptidoglycan/LPS O-acetylase OafA/YrhL